MNRMTSVSFPNGSVQYSYDAMGRRTGATMGNGTSAQYSYDNVSNLDWQRHVFAGGASAAAANDNWFGVDYDYDKSHKLIATDATDSRIMAALPNADTYGAANNLNQVSAVPDRGAMTCTIEITYISIVTTRNMFI